MKPIFAALPVVFALLVPSMAFAKPAKKPHAAAHAPKAHKAPKAAKPAKAPKAPKALNKTKKAK